MCSELFSDSICHEPYFSEGSSWGCKRYTANTAIPWLLWIPHRILLPRYLVAIAAVFFVSAIVPKTCQTFEHWASKILLFLRSSMKMLLRKKETNRKMLRKGKTVFVKALSGKD